MNKTKLAVAIMLSGIVSTNVLATNGYFSHGYGAKEKGMAGAGVAKAGNSLTTANNPANLTQLDDRMDIGISFFNPNRSYNVTGEPSMPAGTPVVGTLPQCTPPLAAPTCQLPFSINTGEVDSNRTLFAIPSFGYVNRIDEKMVYGLALYGNGGMNSEYHGSSARLYDPNSNTIVDAPGTFGNGTTGVDLSQLFINNTIAYQVNDTVSLGASIIIALQSFEATGLQAFANISQDATKLTNNGHDTVFGYGFKLGADFAFSENFTLGVAYQSEMNMDEFEDYSGLFAEGGDFDIPATYTIGAAWDVNDKVTVLLDYQEIMYSDVKSIANGMEPLFQGQCLDALNNTLLNGVQSAAGPGCLGGSNGIGFGWDDMTVIKLGVEWSLGDDTFRLGYSITEQPIGADDVNFNLLAPGVVEDHFTAGYTMGNGENEWTVFLMYAPDVTVSGTSSFDPAQTISFKMNQLEAGVEFRF